ncbi:cytochrome P450 [Dendrothele bispora CBS 962.96]|uniref:Cytochrome P450 n=1 Tax=Dendrothele bispora (strain CBS 962.96) TaxID=1314807 RepID=A0A4S8MV43_DENBC|nr:cytochrome P450 [Dendrothele bispora CBS 962.96]
MENLQSLELLDFRAKWRAIAVSSIIVLFTVFICRKRRIQTKINNIPGPRSKTWAGNYPLLHDTQKGWEFLEHLRVNYGSICRITTPIGCNDMLYVTDPLALYHVVRKDEHLFDDPREIHIMLQMVLGNKGLGATHGAKHLHQRKLLNPIFSSSSLKHTPPIFYNVTNKFIHSIRTLCLTGPTEVIDMSHWGTRVSLELVGQGAVGHSFDSLEIDSVPNLYGEDMKQGFVALSSSSTRLAMKYLLPKIASTKTPALNRALLNLVPSATVGIVKNFIRELEQTSQELFAAKKKELLQGNGYGNDLMTRISASISLTLLFAATDTSSSAILRILFLLAEHPDIQTHVRQEIFEAKSQSGVNNNIPYEKLLSLPWLDAVYRETLRLHPPASYVDRVALEDTVLPLAFPFMGYDGKKINEVNIAKGTALTVSIVGVNRSTAVWGPDALEWKPERWFGELPASVKDFKMPGIYSHMLTFMDGKRHCLGYRYVQMELKILISELLCNFQFSPASTHSKISWPMGLTHSPFIDGKMSMPLIVAPISLPST